MSTHARLIDEFRRELRHHCRDIDEQLLVLAAFGGHDATVLNRVGARLQSLYSLADCMGLDACARIAGGMDAIIGVLQGQRMRLSGTIQDLLFEGLGLLRQCAADDRALTALDESRVRYLAAIDDLLAPLGKSRQGTVDLIAETAEESLPVTPEVLKYVTPARPHLFQLDYDFTALDLLAARQGTGSLMRFLMRGGVVIAGRVFMPPVDLRKSVPRAPRIRFLFATGYDRPALAHYTGLNRAAIKPINVPLVQLSRPDAEAMSPSTASSQVLVDAHILDHLGDLVDELGQVGRHSRELMLAGEPMADEDVQRLHGFALALGSLMHRIRRQKPQEIAEALRRHHGLTVPVAGDEFELDHRLVRALLEPVAALVRSLQEETGSRPDLQVLVSGVGVSWLIGAGTDPSAEPEADVATPQSAQAFCEHHDLAAAAEAVRACAGELLMSGRGRRLIEVRIPAGVVVQSLHRCMVGRQPCYLPASRVVGHSRRDHALPVLELGNLLAATESTVSAELTDGEGDASLLVRSQNGDYVLSVSAIDPDPKERVVRLLEPKVGSVVWGDVVVDHGLLVDVDRLVQAADAGMGG